MFHLNEISYDSKNHKKARFYEFNKLLDSNFETIGVTLFPKHHLDSIVSIKWFV